jgi:hypothetical protein
MALPGPHSLLRECRASVGNSVTGPVFFDHVRRRGLPVLRSPKHITAPIPPDLHERAIIAPEVYWTWSLVWRLDEARAAVPVVVEALSAGVGDLDLHRAVPALSSSCRLVFGRSSWVTSAWSEGARWALPVETTVSNPGAKMWVPGRAAMTAWLCSNKATGTASLDGLSLLPASAVGLMDWTGQCSRRCTASFADTISAAFIFPVCNQSKEEWHDRSE